MTKLFVPKKNASTIWLPDEEWMVVSLVASMDENLRRRKNGRNMSAAIGKIIREWQKQNDVTLPQNGDGAA